MAGMDGTVKTSMRSDVFDYYHYTSANRLRSRPIRTMDVWRNRASNGRASPVYQPWGPWLLREGGSVTSVFLIYPSALWLAGLGGGIFYYIISSFYLYSSIVLLFYLSYLYYYYIYTSSNNNLLYYKFYYKFYYFREISYKSLIKIIKIDKDLYLFKINRYNLFNNSLKFNKVYL